MAAYATAADVKARWIGSDSLPSDAQIETFLDDAEDTILREFPDVPDRITGGTLPASRVRKVAARMVIRFLRNPEGAVSVAQTTGPFSESVTRSSEAPGEVALTDEDRADLRPAATGRRAFSIDTVPFYDAPLVTPWGAT